MNLEQFYQVIEEVDHIVGPSFQKIISEKALEIAPDPAHLFSLIHQRKSLVLDPTSPLLIRYHRNAL